MIWVFLIFWFLALALGFVLGMYYEAGGRHQEQDA